MTNVFANYPAEDAGLTDCEGPVHLGFRDMSLLGTWNANKQFTWQNMRNRT